MAATVLVVIVLIVIAGYAAFFAVVNPEWVEVITFKFSGLPTYTQEMPVWVLPIAGMLIGAILMAIALAGPWGTMRRAAMLSRQQLAAEREKSGLRAKKVSALTKQVTGLQAKMSGTEPVVADDEETPEEEQ